MEKAATLYAESKSKMSAEAMANWGASLLAQNNKQGLEILNEALRKNKSQNIELERAIHANVKKFFQQQKGGGGGEGEENQEQNEDKEKNGGGSGDKSDKQSKGKQGQGDSDGKEKDGKDDKQEDGQGEKEKQQNRPITNLAQREREIDKQRRMMKVPALLKQLMQDDRALQSEFIDTVTQEREQSRAKKDW